MNEIMDEVVGTKTAYLITQVGTDIADERYIEYNAYSGSFSTSDIASLTTRFNSKQQAIDIAKLQNQISKLLNKEFTYRVIEQVVTRTEVYSEPAQEPSPSE